MRLVAEDIALLLGLRTAVDEDRPLMYSTRPGSVISASAPAFIFC